MQSRPMGIDFTNHLNAVKMTVQGLKCVETLWGFIFESQKNFYVQLFNYLTFFFVKTQN